MEAFAVKKRTLYWWKSQEKKGGGKLTALNEQSRRPKHLRTRQWPGGIKTEMKRLRNEHPNLGKEKIYIFLLRFCSEKKLDCPSVSTIGNLIRDMGGLRTFPVKVRHNGDIVPRKRVKRARKPKDFQAQYPGHCGAFDTVEKIIHGSRRYVITFTDLYSRFSFAFATVSHASAAAKEVFAMVRFLFPFELKYILTDNGSEFMKHFDQEVRKFHKEHWHTYPKTPKMNAYAERFNRTIQDEYMDFHASELLNPTHFNLGLMKQLIWHNTERPHHALNLKTPVQHIQNYLVTNAYQLPYQPQECNMYPNNSQQVKLLIAGRYHTIDLLFYHRDLQCLVVVDLKNEKFKDAHVGQMNKYLTYFREHEKRPWERDPIGLIICEERNKEEVHYALGGLEEKIFVAEYRTKLPTEEEIEKRLKKLK